MKTCVVMEAQLYAFLTSPLDRGEWSDSRPGQFTPGQNTVVSNV
jgi:hypothetical protein